MASRPAKSTSKSAKRKPASKPVRKFTPKIAAKQTSSVKTKKEKSPGRRKAKHIEPKSLAVAPTPFELPERFDSAAARNVLDAFKLRRGTDLTVDAGAVRRVGAQGLQILLSATRTWQADGYALSLENASAELLEAAHLLGLSTSELSISGSLQ